jgi:hypothetical protein
MIDQRFCDPFFREELARIVAVEPEMEDIRVKAITDYVANLEPGSGLMLYGCGSLPAIIARDHSDLLGRVDAVFVTTKAPRQPDFHGFPWISVCTARQTCQPKAVMLMSTTYADEMYPNVAGMANGNIVALLDILKGLSNEVLGVVVGRIKATAERLAAKIQATFTEPTVCYAASFDFNPPFYAAMRGQGFPLVALSMRAYHLPPVIPEIGPEFGDYAVNIYGFAAFRILLAQLVAICPFRAVVIQHLGFDLFYSQLISAACISPLIVWQDLFFSMFCRDDKLRAYHEGHMHVDLACIEAIEASIYQRAVGVITRHRLSFMEAYQARHGHTYDLLQIFPPMYSMPPAPPRDPLTSKRRLRMVFATGIYAQDKDQSPAYSWSRQDIVEASQILDCQGVDFTVYNYRDRGEGDFKDLEAYAQSHPHFTYHGAVPKTELLRVLPCFDFAWMCRKFDDYAGHFSRQHVNTSLFTYMEAGVPVVISRELEFMAELVEHWFVGFCVGRDQWNQVAELCRKFDYQKYQKNVEQVHAWLSEERLGREVGRFIARLTRK